LPPFLRSWWGEYIFIILGKEEKKEQAQVESDSLKALHSSALPTLASLQDSTDTAATA